uniref:Kinase n=2 Tax=Timema TaxID=61471 RepID=A0A7R9F482_9NEOP|nr:unnamed protein product [Timema bartmani]
MDQDGINFKKDLNMSATVFVRKKDSENVLKMNGINAKLYRPCDCSEGPSLPPGITVLDNQVAGHSFTKADSSLGILKHTDGSVLKPILKPGPGAREIQFYKNLQQSTDPVSVELRGFVPEFRGTTTVTVNGRDVECIVLENVTNEFVEPCIMDIKIGRQTWDPEASSDKIETEKAKYADSRKEYGFCIPGFQVYRMSTGKVIRLGKDYGKKLNKETIKDALKLFLNADSGLNRHLLLQLLSKLWRILRWCRRQRRYRIYASSLLLMYDARRLRQNLRKTTGTPERPMSPVLSRAHSFAAPILCRAQSLKLNLALRSNSALIDEGSFTGRITNRGSYRSVPTTPTRISSPGIPEKSRSLVGAANGIGRSLSQTISRSLSFVSASPAPPPLERQSSNGSWHFDFKEACRTHSLVNNYEKDLQSMKDNYKSELDDLVSEEKPGDRELWTKVKMIDFAHTFSSVDDEGDTNYLEGLENLIKLLESLFQDF